MVQIVLTFIEQHQTDNASTKNMNLNGKQPNVEVGCIQPTGLESDTCGLNREPIYVPSHMYIEEAFLLKKHCKENNTLNLQV